MCIDGAQIANVAERIDADAIVRGYGFLLEDANFARTCQRHGI